ncbi:MAG TPA: acyl-CoA dehydrogenase family protein [Frankiaceae bacterium]|nr:acyl-CoA dehydrogenase family protein [Frankiaceae bacterium]
MFFALTDEQRALQATVRDYLGDRFPLSAVREVYDDPSGDGAPAELWKAFGEQGWLAVLVPEEHDGLGLDLLDAVVLSRAFGAGAVPGPWLGTIVAGEAIRLAGSDEVQKTWLPRLAAGEVRLAFAPDLTQPVEYAGVADAIVAVQDGALVLLEPSDYSVEPLAVMDRTTRLGRVTVTGGGTALEAGSASVVGSPVDQVLDRATVLVAADLSGIARESLTRTVQYDKDRVQFGRPVGSFQAIKHHLADLHVSVTMAEHGVLFAAHALDAGLDDAKQAVSIAKAKASDSAREVTAAMIQYHGGIGYTWEHDAHFFFKRAKREEYAYGSASEHREKLAKLLVDD